MKSLLRESAGAFGDVGMLLPVALALMTTNGLNPFWALFIPGLMYIFVAYYYRLPVSVQPLKVFCATAIAVKASLPEITTGAILIGIIFILLSFESFTRAVAKVFTLPVIRGIQLGTGLMLIQSGLGFIMQPFGHSVIALPGGFSMNLGILFGIISALILLVLPNSKLPVSLFVLGLGITVGRLIVTPTSVYNGTIQPAYWHLTNDPGVWWKSLVLLVLAQIPLSLGNAVFATVETTRNYFGAQAVRVNAQNLLRGMGVFNILAGLVGGIPVCHGSGGITAHYRFGARTWRAPVIIGIAYLALAFATLFLGESVLKLIPMFTLGVLLAFVGLEHCLLIRDVSSRRDLIVIMTVASLAVATKNMTIAFVTGMAVGSIMQSKEAESL